MAKETLKQISRDRVMPKGIDRQFRKDVAPYILKYKSEPHTPELINETWQGFWGALGKSVGFEYIVPQCKFTKEEIAGIERKHRAVLLLPDDIFKPEGLGKLCKVFPVRMRGASDQKELSKIFNSSGEGGCVVTEMQLFAPNMIAGGYDQFGLTKKIEFDGGVGQRLATYIVASKFCQLVMRGHQFDEHEIWSRIIGSTYEGEALAASSDSNGYIELRRCPPNKQSSNLGGRSEFKTEFWKDFSDPEGFSGLKSHNEVSYFWKYFPNPDSPEDREKRRYIWTSISLGGKGSIKE